MEEEDDDKEEEDKPCDNISDHVPPVVITKFYAFWIWWDQQDCGGSSTEPLAQLDDWKFVPFIKSMSEYEMGGPLVCVPAKCEVGPSYLALVLYEWFVVMPGKVGRGGDLGNVVVLEA
eukprot:7057767-Ditylum_brightwellii.AAC.1